MSVSVALVYGAALLLGATERTRLRFTEGGVLGLDEARMHPERHAFAFSAFGTRFALEANDYCCIPL